MKIIAFIEARQADVIEKILKQCGLWNPPPPRPPPSSHPSPARQTTQAVEIDPDFLEHLHREEQAQQLRLPWDP